MGIPVVLWSRVRARTSWVSCVCTARSELYKTSTFPLRKTDEKNVVPAMSINQTDLELPSGKPQHTTALTTAWLRAWHLLLRHCFVCKELEGVLWSHSDTVQSESSWGQGSPACSMLCFSFKYKFRCFYFHIWVSLYSSCSIVC